MLKVLRIDHVAVCVADVDAAATPWRAFLEAADRGALSPLPPAVRELVGSQRTDALLLPVDAEACIELVAPKGNEGLERFLARRGPGLHHVAFEVEGIEEAIAAVKALGMEMIDEVPRIGARGHKVAFLHPRAMGGVLIELLERQEPRPAGRVGSSGGPPVG